MTDDELLEAVVERIERSGLLGVDLGVIYHTDMLGLAREIVELVEAEK